MVEEFTTTDRYDTKGGLQPRGRTIMSPRGVHIHSVSLEGTNLKEANSYQGDVEDTDGDRETVSWAATDSISALSEPDLTFLDRRIADNVRRRALGDAIEQEDWDRAAAYAEGIRSSKLQKQKNANHEDSPLEWAQSALDQFISENDWDAVAGYIAQLRSGATEEAKSSKPGRPSPNRKVRSDPNDSPQRRFGARSQLQHTELDSSDDSSYTSGSYEDEYTSGSYYSDEEPPVRSDKKPQEFSC
jgi:hypothetical protein